MIFSGHQHLNVTSVEAHRRFFADTLGGTLATDGTLADAIVRFPNVLIQLRPQPSTGGTKGTTVNHVAFGVSDIRDMVDTVRDAGYPIVTRTEVAASLAVDDGLCYMADQRTYVAFMMAPDDTKIEFIEIEAQAEPIAFHHIHFAAPDLPEMKAWYVRVLDAKPGKRGNFEAADLPGVNLTYSPASAPVVGTRGRTLDHIGFEINGFNAWCEKLEAMGIAFERSSESASSANVASAFVTDPWGTYIELTEGLGVRPNDA
jgi:catechol 2,3-dioxygenase-like lactoylglutathione lyase family enzyme